MLARMILLAAAFAVAGGYLLKVDSWAAWLAFAGAGISLICGAVAGVRQAKRRRVATAQRA